jgi:hypothetical protein
MELCYRGSFYQAKSRTASIQKNDRLSIGKYRGVMLQLNQFTSTNSPQASLKLTCRGATYLRLGVESEESIKVQTS